MSASGATGLDGPVEVKILCPGRNWMNVGSLVAHGMGGYHGALPSGSTIAAYTGTPPSMLGLQGPGLVTAGDYQLAITTPAWALSMARAGIGMYDRPHPLTTIASFAHEDVLLLAVRRELGITSLEQIAAERIPLRISMPTRDQWHPAGWVLDRIFSMLGFSQEDVERWGGTILRDRPRNQNSPDVVPADPSFQAVFDEAVMTHRWLKLSRDYDLNFLPLSESIVERCGELGIPRGTLLAGRLRGVEIDTPTLDFDGWVMYCAEQLPDELAYLAVAAIDEQREAISERFTGPTAAMTSPIDMRALSRNPPVPLHPGAERYYREHGYLD